MPPRSPTIPSRYVRLALQYADSLGVAQGTVLAAAGLSNDAPAEAFDACITLTQFDAVLATIASRTGRSDTGFEIGRRITFELHGALGLAIQRCADVGQAMAMAARHYAFMNQSFTMRYERTTAGARLLYRPQVGMTHQTLCAMYEIHAASFGTLLPAAVTRRVPPYDIYLPMDPPPHAARYLELAPARVHFGPLPLPELRIEFDAAIRDMPMALADRRYVSRAEGRLEEWVPKIASESPWSEWVALVLQEAEDCRPTLAQVAEFVELGPHTLARRLAEEGQNFRDLSNRVRHERACDLLRQTRTPVSQIAYRLGYSDLGNFSNAFRRTAGQSPRAFREAARAG